MNKSEVKIERIRGTGPGGQNQNKVNSCIRATHKATGIVVTINGRDQGRNLKKAMKELERRVAELATKKTAAAKKAKRDAKLVDQPTVRTYDLRKGEVRDHRTKKKASVKDILHKGRLDLLND